MAIPLSRLIKVNPGVISATGNAVDLNGVILSDNITLPIGTPLSFGGADTVRKKFGSASDEYAAAQIYFRGVANSTITPSKLYFSRFNREESNAFLVGNNLNYNLAQLKALKGTFGITINGDEFDREFDFEQVTSFSDAVEMMNDIIPHCDASYNEITKQIIIKAKDVEEDEETSITYATGELAVLLGLTEDTGAYVSPHSKVANASDFFTKLLNKTANWYSFTTLFESTDAQHLDLSSWVNAQESRYTYVAWTTNSSALVSGNQNTILYQIEKINDYADVTPIYCTDFKKPVNILGYFASLNFDQVNGRVQLAYRTLSGLTSDVDSAEDYDALSDNGYNFYGSYAANIDDYAIWQPGRVTGKFAWCDAHAGQVWLNANIQKNIVTNLMGGYNMPYDAVGRELFSTPLVGLLERFKAWGGCSAGTDLDENQKQQITQLVGFDISSSLYSNGYYIYVGQFTAAMRAARTSPTCYVIYTDGGAFRTIELNSIEVQ